MFGTAIGRLRILIGGDAADLNFSLLAAEKRIKAFSGGLGRLQAVTAAVGITAVVAALVHFTTASFATIDAQSKLGQRLKGTTEDIQTLTHAADLAGVSNEALAKAAFKLTQGLAEAARTGAGPAYEALRRLGLSAKDLLKVDVSERLALISDRMEELGYTTDQQADVLKQFGIRGQEMLSLFEGGGKSIRQARDDVKAFGVAVSQIDGAAVEQANDAWTTAKLLLTGISNQITVALAPIVKELGDQFAAAGRASGGFAETVQMVVRTTVIGIAQAVDWVKSLGRAWEYVRDAAVIANAVLNPFSRNFKQNVTDSLDALKSITGKLAETRDEGAKAPTTEDWDRWFGYIKLKSEMNAKAVADARNAALGAGGATTDPMTEEQRKQAEARLANLRRSIATEDMALKEQREKELLQLQEFEQKKIIASEAAAVLRLQIADKHDKAMKELIQARLEEGILTEDEILARKYEKQLVDLTAFEANKTLTEARAADIRKRLAAKTADDLRVIEARKWGSLADTIDTAMSRISTLVGEEGGAAFEVMKAISMATALVKGYEAVVSAYASGEKTGIPGMGAVMAGITAAGVAAQIAALAATRPGSAGGAPVVSAGGGGGAAPAAAAAPVEQQDRTLIVSGFNPRMLYAGSAMRDFVEELNKFIRNGGTRVVVA